MKQVAAGTLDPRYLPETAGAADRDGVRGPGGREVHAGADLENHRTRDDGRGTLEEAFVRELLRLEGLGKEPAEQTDFVGGERALRGHVEAELRFYPVDCGRNLLPRRCEQAVGLEGRKGWCAIKMEKDHGMLFLFET